MRRALRLHPDGERGPVIRIEAGIARPHPHLLTLTFELTGCTAELRLPPPARTARADGLWRQTCFEAFLRLGEGQDYVEFNLSPSSRWAAYRFSGYRAGMTPLEGIAAPRISLSTTEDGLTLNASLDLGQAMSERAPWRLGLSAVIEDQQDRISCWALAHPPGKPDFHHADCFACEVRAPDLP